MIRDIPTLVLRSIRLGIGSSLAIGLGAEQGTGIRAALESSLERHHSAPGVVDKS